MPIVGDCRTVPFISCAHYWAALRLPGLHQRAGECRPGKAQPPPGIEAGTALGWAALRLPGRQNVEGVTDAAERFPSLQGEG